MRPRFHDESSRRVLRATLEALGELGYRQLTRADIDRRARWFAPDLEGVDVDEVVVAALQGVRLFDPPLPTGSLRGDLEALLSPWRGPLCLEERAVFAVLSEAPRRGPVQHAAFAAIDRTLVHATAVLLARRPNGQESCPQRLQTLVWILRGVAMDRLMTGTARSEDELTILASYLLDGLHAGSAA